MCLAVGFRLNALNVITSRPLGLPRPCWEISGASVPGGRGLSGLGAEEDRDLPLERGCSRQGKAEGLGAAEGVSTGAEKAGPGRPQQPSMLKQVLGACPHGAFEGGERAFRRSLPAGRMHTGMGRWGSEPWEGRIQPLAGLK